jgi:menaquinone-9 beta-reductase
MHPEPRSRQYPLRIAESDRRMPSGPQVSKPQESGAVADVAIIGAGPAGLAAAIHLGQLGVRRVVICDRRDFPRNKTCGSAISPKGIEVLEALAVKDAVLSRSYPIKGMRLVTPRRHDVMLSGHADTAIVCLRRIFDHLLLDRARETGSTFIPNFQASFLLQRGDRIVGFRGSDGREIRARYTIVADGAHSQFAIERGPPRLIQAIMGWWEGAPFRANHIEMIFDDLVRPLYGWLFPESPTRINIGICYEDADHALNARQLFAAFLDKHYRERLAGAQAIGNLQGHPISYSTRVGKLTSPGRIVIGEAGRMTHPATAEGIYQGMRSGMLAAEALRAIFDGEDPARAMRRYEAGCRKVFRASFLGAALWRRAVDAGALDVVAGALNRPVAQRTLAGLMARM